MILPLLLAVLAAGAQEPAVDGDAQAVEDARQRDVLVRLNRERIARLTEGLAIVDQTERQCTPAWADELRAVWDTWQASSDALIHELLHPGDSWVKPPTDMVSTSASQELRPELEAAEAAFMEHVRPINRLKTRCPEHEAALQGVYALGKHGFILR